MERVTQAELGWSLEILDRVRREIGRFVIGKDKEVKLALATMIARGHLLVEGVPGVAKTTLAKALAGAFGLRFSRIQFTPDTLPSDVIGTHVFVGNGFVFRRGPVFANVVLADEVNRANPRTQSAFLEAMQEGQVTVWGETHRLPNPFIVLATMNPIELEGVYPLPEAQLDRFMARIRLEYPSRSEEVKIIEKGDEVEDLNVKPAAAPDDLKRLQDTARRIYVDRKIVEYIADIVRETRTLEEVEIGASPRAGIHVLKLSRALALMSGRDFTTPDDVKEAARAVLPHRIKLRKVYISKYTVEGLVEDVLKKVPPP
ncbi:AAA family ATPase [Aeropyrum camini]|uniref:MoxR-like ATPase n=3 Tax=Aeropyrum camini TaxID=229980 RepID=U3TC89_9CREN|nr:MoxR family ATPase [Aeropyrum camini]BAN89568.1 MoxR-like ATPase [Aeropyrum camini SY1 = JCM 12091]